MSRGAKTEVPKRNWGRLAQDSTHPQHRYTVSIQHRFGLPILKTPIFSVSNIILFPNKRETRQTFNTRPSIFSSTLFIGMSSYVASCFTKKPLILLMPFSESFKIESKRSLVFHQVTNIFEQELQDHQRPSLLTKVASLDMNGWLLKVLEKLYREGCGVDDGVGSIIICSMGEIAHQTFQVLNAVGKYHDFRAGFLHLGVHDINILITTPEPLLHHDFDSSKLEVLVPDEADHLVAKKLDAIISQLPNKRQTFLFSTIQTVLVQDLARISLKQAVEYLTVHAEFEMDFPFPVRPSTPTDLPRYNLCLVHSKFCSEFCSVQTPSVLLSTDEDLGLWTGLFKWIAQKM